MILYYKIHLFDSLYIKTCLLNNLILSETRSLGLSLLSKLKRVNQMSLPN
jgi:hypothetical protein